MLEETYYVRAFDWRNYELYKEPLAFSDNGTGFMTFQGIEGISQRNMKKTL